MLSVIEAKRTVLDKHSFIVIEEPDLGLYEGDPIKGEARTPDKIAIWSSLDDTMKLIAIAHEAGHLIDYKHNPKEYLHGAAIKCETIAWVNGLPLAIEMGIFEGYIGYWKISLGKF